MKETLRQNNIKLNVMEMGIGINVIRESACKVKFIKSLMSTRLLSIKNRTILINV